MSKYREEETLNSEDREKADRVEKTDRKAKTGFTEALFDVYAYLGLTK